VNFVIDISKRQIIGNKFIWILENILKWYYIFMPTFMCAVLVDSYNCMQVMYMQKLLCLKLNILCKYREN